MPVIGGTPEALRDDLQAQALADNILAEQQTAADKAALESSPFDPEDIVRQMRGEPARASAEAYAIAAKIRQANGY